MLGIQGFLLNTLTRFKKSEQALGSLNIGVSRRKNAQQISGTGAQALIFRNGSRLYPFVVLKPESKQLCLKLRCRLLYLGLFWPDKGGALALEHRNQNATTVQRAVI